MLRLSNENEWPWQIPSHCDIHVPLGNKAARYSPAWKDTLAVEKWRLDESMIMRRLRDENGENKVGSFRQEYSRIFFEGLIFSELFAISSI